MSQVEHILSEAMAHNIVLYLKDGQLTYASSGTRLPTKLREKIVAHKANIIEYLMGLQPEPGSTDASVRHVTVNHEPLADLMTALAEQDVHVYVQEGKLKTRSKPGVITPDMAAQIRDHKQALIDHLSAASKKAIEITAMPLLTASEHTLSYAQQRLWFLDRFKSGNISYNMPIALRLNGKLDSEALRRSLDEIMRRHAVLRSTYKKTAAGPVQVIQPVAPIAMPIVDIRDLPEADQGPAVAQLARAEVERAFDLTRDPMLRVTLLRLADERYVLYVTLHHIAADGWSLGVLLKELAALYGTSTTSLPPSLPPLSHQYADYARWQQQFCKSEQVTLELDYWRAALSGIPHVHSLPLDKPRPIHQRAEGGVIHRHLDLQTLAVLQHLAKQHKATLFMLLHAAFALLLGRWSDQRDIVIGTPVAGRYLPMTESLIGFFINTLVLRTRLDEDANFEQLLLQSKACTLDAYEHQNIPFEMLVEALNPPRNLGYTPLFQVMFALQNYELGDLSLPDLAIEVMQPEFALAKFDLALMAMEGKDGLAMSWVYADSLFESGNMTSLVDSFVTLLKAIAAAPQSVIFDLPLLSEEQHAATMALARAGEDGQLALDRRGCLQPAGAWGVLYALDRRAGTSASPLQPLSKNLRTLGKSGRLRVDGRSEVKVLSDSSPPLAKPVIAVHAPPTHELEHQLCEVWRAVLATEHIGIHDNFFDVGGSSMQCVMLQQEIETQLGRDISITDLFTYPTIATFARYLQDGERPLADNAKITHEAGRDGIAIVGMAGRFPDAIDVDAFWENIKNGVESVRHYSDDTLRAAGVSEELLRHPAYVKSGVLLDGIEDFDAAYFGFTPREAEVTDPQQRLLFECAVEALENAGYGNDANPRSVAVHVGIGESRYLFEHLLPQSAQLENAFIAAMYGNRSDFVATRLSYRLNLCGPSMTVGTACSSSLVAVHNACVSLLNNECELALAGGASLLQITPQGYLYQEGGISSPDGHCRAFDRAAKGTRSGSGAALVVLKRLSRALADGDTIHAVIKGSAVNNDGADKVGYTAPSVAGQAQVIREAQRVAGVDPESIQYIEAHGTGTELGDPIEIKALTRAFATQRRQYCALSSVKPNVGHLDTAAGVAGLIKTVAALKHRQLPPSIHYETPNPKIDFDNSPFYVNTQLTAWQSDGERRAGVSSFGIGGTNAHVVLEEAPAEHAGHSHRTTQLLLLSAKTETALQTMSARLAAHLKRGASMSLTDVAYTLQVGRTRHPYRCAWVCESVDEAVTQLEGPSTATNGDAGSVVLMFTGQGAQYAGMGAELYKSEPEFRRHFDACVALLPFRLDNGGEFIAESGFDLDQTVHAQPVLFALEYSLAKLLQSWGVQPAAMIGHSLGEFVAACLAGVMSLEDALKLVVARGQFMQAMAPGRMLALELNEEAARAALAGSGCDMAAVNSARHCVATGSPEAIAGLQEQLEARGVACQPLRTAHAFHSALMDPMLDAWRAELSSVTLHPPQLPYVSNVSGTYITDEEATSVEYWAMHLRQTVRFAAGIDTLLSAPGKRVLLEVGPGRVLSGLVRKHAQASEHTIVPALRHAHDTQNDTQALSKAVGQLWQAGVAIDWDAYHAEERCRRVPLPAYPFERQRYWIERGGAIATASVTSRAQQPRDALYAPAWKQLAPLHGETDASGPLWLVFGDVHGIGTALRERLAAQGAETVMVTAGNAYRGSAGQDFVIDAAVEVDYVRLLRDLAVAPGRPMRAVLLWSMDAEIGFDSLLYLARNLATSCPSSATIIDVVTDQALCVTATESVDPSAALAVGLCKVIPQELAQCRSYHIDLHRSVNSALLAKHLAAEITAAQRPVQVAWRGHRRWGMTYERCDHHAGAPRIQLDGHYLITGGLGRIGLALAEHLAALGASGVSLIARGAPITEHHERLQRMESSGCKLLTLTADVGDYAAMSAAFDQAEQALGPIHGVIHGAGKVRHAMQAIHDLAPSASQEHFHAKVRGTQVLARLVDERNIDFCLLMSSLSAVLGGLGLGAYAAANCYLDAFVQGRHSSGDSRWLSVNWDGWLFDETGLRSSDRHGVTPFEGADTFEYLLHVPAAPQWVHSSHSLDSRMAKWLHMTAAPNDKVRAPLHARPSVATEYVEPASATERQLIAIWQDMLGIEQIGIRDNFFELGGDSVMLVQVHKAIRALGHAHVTVANLFQFPAIAELANFIDSAQQQASAENIINKRLNRRRERDIPTTAVITMSES